MKNLKIKDAVRYFLIHRGVKAAWHKRYEKMFNLNPEYKSSITKTIENEHLKFWSVFPGRVNLQTLRACAKISGISNIKYIPEEVYATDIEPTLNKLNTVEYISNKSFYEVWFKNSPFPKTYFSNIDGNWFDQSLNQIDPSEVLSQIRTLDYPVVLKPNKDTFGGDGVFFPKNPIELSELIKNKYDFVVQEKIKQHPFFEKFNSFGVNTIRVCLYKSVKDNKNHVINCSLRMGVGGSLDNETAGGIVCFINENGFLNGTARDKYGKNYISHPDTGYSFFEEIPNYLSLQEAALKISDRIFYARLTSLDFCMDINGIWRPIEINIFGQTIRFAQYAGFPYFGQFTDEVKDYCKENHWILKK